MSGTGMLVYQLADTTGRSLVWVERDGTVTPADTSMRAGFDHVAISPEGDRLAMSITDAPASSIWVRQLSTGAMTRLTFEGDNSDRPVWSPDGRYVGYLGTRERPMDGAF